MMVGCVSLASSGRWIRMKTAIQSMLKTSQTILSLPRGKAPVQMYHPDTKQWRFDETDVPLTKEQILEELVEAVRELTTVLKERK
jgi:hypothetical protein